MGLPRVRYNQTTCYIDTEFIVRIIPKREIVTVLHYYNTIGTPWLANNLILLVWGGFVCKYLS